MSNTTLTEIFDAHKEALAKELGGFSLPKDSKEVQATVTTFLNNMFENDGTYRQGLTQSEDYILQCAIQLLNAQQDIANEIVAMASTFNASPKQVTTLNNNPNNPYMSIVGTGVGAVAGSLLGTWGAIAGAIAGTAIAVYLSVKPKKVQSSGKEEEPIKTINVNAFINIIRKICESIDNLMETYRVQAKRIQNSYEQKEQPSLLNECSALFSQIANLHKVISANQAETPTKVLNASYMLFESLENYGLVVKDGKVVSE